MSVTAETLHSKLAQIDGDAVWRATLRRGAAEFFAAHLSGDALVRRWAAILDTLKARQRPSPPPQNGCSCDAAGDFPECAKCEITRKRGRTIEKFIGIIPRKRWDLKGS